MANETSEVKVDQDPLGTCDKRITMNDGSLRCSYAAQLAGLAADKCRVGEDACRFCLTQSSRPNEVIASMAMRAASENELPKSDQERIGRDLSKYLKKIERTPVKRATAADLPCIYRGELLRVISCEICGAKGEPVEVHQCWNLDTDSTECTPGRWTNDPTKTPSQHCLTCSHRTVSVNLEGDQSPQLQPALTVPPEIANSKNPCRLTIGMACYDDEPGTFFTVQALRMYHADILNETNAEILVIDSNPGSKHGKSVKELCDHWGGGPNGSKILRYIPADFAKGTSAPRDLVFREARGEIVLCIDCHVMLAPGALRALVDYFTENPNSIDLIQGPMLHHGCEIYATGMKREWGPDGMLGRWETDPKIWDLDSSPFEIVGHGMGLFACRKLAWRGFNPAFQGFGGEEIQYHDKVRAAGGKCICLPELQWLHKFSRVDGVPYRLNLEDRFRNYLIGHMELGKDITEVIRQFSGRIPADSLGRIVGEVATIFKTEQVAT